MSQSRWQRGVAALTAIYITRMLGLFMIFPVFSLYANELAGANKTLVGIALGIYGLSQGLLQIPCGWLSDRYGRKPVIAGGLALFVAGSLLAAAASDIYMMIAARAVQGMGAIAAVALAYATDITPPEKLGKTMAILGASIGIAFVLSLILGPLIANWIGVAGLFALIALLAAAALAASLRLPAVARPTASGTTYNAKPVYQAAATIFTLHAVFTATFLVLPPLLVAGGIDKTHHWWLYLPANLIALAFMRPKNSPHPLTFGVNYLILAAGAALLAVPIAHTAWLLAALTVYFIAFYRLETGLPHWVAQNAAPDSRGKAMGIYSSAQFIGSFSGGAIGGRLWQNQSPGVVLTALAIASAAAALILLKMGKTATLRGANEP
ncbi:MAG: MFS transporter [Cardiobacterium sp.]